MRIEKLPRLPLAAIPALNQKVEEGAAALRAELNRRDAENAVLKRELVELTKLVNAMNQQLNGSAQ